MHKILRLEEIGGKGSPNSYAAVIGIYRTHQEFVSAASEARHPFDSVCGVPDVLRRNVFFCFTQGKVALAKHRLAVVVRLRNIVQSHKCEEDAALSKLAELLRC